MNSQRITSLANATSATDALNRQTGDGRYYIGNRYYAFKILLGDVPFSTGSTNVVYSLVVDSTNVPVN